VIQGALALTIMLSPAFGGYAFAAAFFAGVMIFTHTFIFGFLAREDASGRAVAATPAMLMTGSAIAPFLGGALVQLAGYSAIGIAAAAIAVACCLLFWSAARNAGFVDPAKVAT
jgi:predicted MFS family arabinose efflux permease